MEDYVSNLLKSWEMPELEQVFKGKYTTVHKFGGSNGKIQ